MNDLDLNPRLRVQVVLALMSEEECQATRHRQEKEAQDLGLTGAEIDAARRGGSFDRSVAAVIAYACAVRGADPYLIGDARRQALLAGNTSDELMLVDQLIAYLLDMTGEIKAAS